MPLIARSSVIHPHQSVKGCAAIHPIPNLLDILRILAEQVTAGKFVDHDLRGVSAVVGLPDTDIARIGGDKDPAIASVFGTDGFHLRNLHFFSCLAAAGRNVHNERLCQFL